ncbi:GNAT family N-acetyltransferase [Niveibacterium sp. 24ML]|uniref:GNAT family N-acetyltransferase n=1 Tax=Niveibacterium sp. 24ML TaxID=2985512 RepID=UPI0022716DA0|nr:GNAT family N-acetyltransferase [Niveibacterium sp. 24ML]MCX9155515.1 GNAT family N-acetyltransferase [Niveibacterium sp. 24ML]
MPTDRAAALELAPLTALHAEAFWPHAQTEALYAFVPIEAPASKAELAAWFARLAAGAPARLDEEWLNWAVVLPQENTVAGIVQATVMRDYEAELAYLIAPAFWGRGIGITAVRAMVDWLWRERAVVSLRAVADTRNLRSQSLLEELGFVLAGEVASSIRGERTIDRVYAGHASTVLRPA